MKTIITCILVIIISLQVNCQKVGLVLSGGGARGLAHIGVLKSLEENNIPIDYIAGTSMGAIIGGLYSIGYSPDEILELIKSEDFTNWAFGKMPEDYKYYFKEEDPAPVWLELNFRYDSVLRPVLPTNLVSTHQMDFAFMQLFAPAAANADYNFDSLFIPFRCVASDVHKNEEVVFRRGELPSAIRASMTFPFYFKPVTVNGKLLFDGGMHNNFPVNIMEQDFQPNIIIGSKVVSNSIKPNEDDIILQIENMLLGKTNYDIPEDRGILIEPKIVNVGLMDFYMVDYLSISGYLATEEKIQEIKSRIPTRISKDAVNNKREKYKAQLPELYIQNIHIKGLNSHQMTYVTKSLRHKKKIISKNELKKEYFKLIADNKIESAYPIAFFNKENGYFDLFLDIRKKKKFKAELGGNISNSPINQMFAAVEYIQLDKQAYSLKANGYFGKFYNSAQIKGRMDIPARLPYFVDCSITFNRWDYFRSYSDLFFEDYRPAYLIQNETNFQSNIGFPIGNQARFITGIAAGESYDKYYQTKEFYRSDTTDKSFFDYVTLHASFERKTLNYVQFGNQGAYYLAKLRYVNGKEIFYPGSSTTSSNEFRANHGFFRAEVKLDKLLRTGKVFSLGFYLHLLHSTQKFSENYTASMLSASSFSPFPHVKTLFIPNYIAHSFGGAGLKAVFRLSKRLDYRVEGYLFQPYKAILQDENNNAYYGEPFQNHSIMASTSFIYHTPVGPASLSLNYYDKQGKKFYFLFHFGYILFNKRGDF